MVVILEFYIECSFVFLCLFLNFFNYYLLIVVVYLLDFGLFVMESNGVYIKEEWGEGRVFIGDFFYFKDLILILILGNYDF